MLSKVAQVIKQQAKKIAELEKENHELKQKIMNLEKKASDTKEEIVENGHGLFFGEIDENSGKMGTTPQDVFARFFPAQ